jgi:NDP-sugar pyrophosphorylase family protein
MRALVLCAGLGTRLGSLTLETPKPMLELEGTPIVSTIVGNLVRQGVRDIAINLHHRPEAIVSCLGDGAQLGARIRYSYEPELLGTLGAAKQLERFLIEDGPFLLHYGDVVADGHFGALAALHAKRKALVTIAVHERPGSNSVVVLEADGRVSRFVERPEADDPSRLLARWAFSGIALLDPPVLARVPPGRRDLPRDLLPELADEGALYAVPLTGYRCAIDSVERLEQARVAVRERRCRTYGG